MPKMLLIVSAAVLGSVLAAVAVSRKRQETDDQHDDNTPAEPTGPTATTEGTGLTSPSSAPYSS